MPKQKILIIGSGGREHAIGWKIKQSPRCGELYFAPGNAGTSSIGINVDFKAVDIKGLIDFVKKEHIDVTLAIPDDPLALGIVDEFKKENLRIFGPTKNAAQLEWSKAFSKNFMRKHGLPTAKFDVCHDYKRAESYVKNHSFPIVIKVSGLALGKGVFICGNYTEAEKTLNNILNNKSFGEAGNEVVIEEFLTGPEISTHVFTDGKTYSIFPPSQDHKRIGENDEGPNTGGMGTVAPLPIVSDELMKEIEGTIIASTLSKMNEDGNTFSGVLYPGLMLTPNGPKILEYNARFGDPETQTYMRLLDTDLLDIIDACIDGTLDKIKINWKKLSACTIVLASGGYPESYEKGKIISGIENASGDKDIVIFHAGTKYDENRNLITNGGRVLGVSATGNTLKEALAGAYEAVKKISFEKMYYRRDIGKKVL
jgi:phosphoribosylamine--glycine ligase